ncbi:EF-hand calcium-binding domain-containing protein 7-like isoform X2 [Ylistrum balloti]|uniref:EF-hand calcium-binding domain-containing protein 7-like isoform X2 n=1 Tax=Ylistrum balloti TaxID=509963 RepID=UPI002905A5BC|nr:EF-hand calcium-binding domain-containing protein 7-like isoform X2 [Ylistrum balloti]
MSRRPSRASITDGDFILDCKAAYSEVMDDVRKKITSKSLLLQALQESGRNPSERVLKKYWNSETESLSFDDFVDICRKVVITSEEEMMKAFKKIDINGDGFLTLDELRRIMTSNGEKMTRQEVQEIIDEVDENGDGKLDFKERKFYYEQFCNMNKNTADQLRQQNRKRLERKERDRKSKKTESFSDSKRGDVASMGSQISMKSNSSQRTSRKTMGSSASIKSEISLEDGGTSTSKMMGSCSSIRSDSTLKASEHDEEDIMEEIPEDLEEDDDDDDIQTTMTPSDVRRHSIRSSGSSFKRSTESELGSKTSLRSSRGSSACSYNTRHRKHDDDEEAEEVEDEEEEVVMTSSRRRSSGSRTDLSSSFKSRLKSSGELIHGSHTSLRSGEKDPSSTPVPAQRKTLSRSVLAEDDMPRPSPRTHKKGQPVKHIPASKLGQLTDQPKNKGDWTKVSNKGCFFVDDEDGLMTHIYRLTLKERSKVWITIQPTSPQSMIIGDVTPIDTMLLITKKKPDAEGRSVVAFTEKRDGKGKYGVMCELKAGTYNLLPFTTGCNLKPRRSDSSKETPLVRKKDGKTTITKAFRKALVEIFELSDLDSNGTLSRDEFTWFTMRTSGDKVSDDEWEVVTETVELQDDEVTEKGFLKLNEMEADDVDDDISDLWVTLHSMGYNKDLFIDEACPFKLDVFAENCDDADVSLTCTGIETINNDKIIETVMEQNEAVKIKSMVYMYTYANDTRSTVVLENKSTNRVKISMDCTSSKNCQINRDKEEYIITLDPDDKQIAHHLMPLDETLDWTPRCVETVTK